MKKLMTMEFDIVVKVDEQLVLKNSSIFRVGFCNLTAASKEVNEIRSSIMLLSPADDVILIPLTEIDADATFTARVEEPLPTYQRILWEDNDGSEVGYTLLIL